MILPAAIVDLRCARADDAALAPAAGHEGRVAGHAAAGGENALGRAHAFDVLGVGLFADEDHRLVALLGDLDGVVGGEDDLAARAARDRPATPGRHGFDLRPRIEIGCSSSSSWPAARA